jgi:hypothetical protein
MSGSLGIPDGFSAMTLRLMQYSVLSRAAWTGKGRNAADNYIVLMSQVANSNAQPNSAFDSLAMKGSNLVTTNTIYAAFGGLGGVPTAISYNASPNRPCDNITAVGLAAYWESDYIRATSDSLGAPNPVTDNANWLQASKDYANGLTSTAFTAMAAMFASQRGAAQIAPTGSSYNNGTGVVILNLVAPINTGTLNVGDSVLVTVVTGTGAVQSIAGHRRTTIATSSGTTLTFNAGASLGAMTITGGTVLDATASNYDSASGANLTALLVSDFQQMELMAAQYDASRAALTPALPPLGFLHYEGAPQWGFNNNGTDGTNNLGNPSLANLITQMTNLSWNVSAYTLSGTDDKTEMAQMALNLIQGWKFDLSGLSPTVGSGTPANTGSYKNFIKTYYYQALVGASAGKNREVKPAQYGYQFNTWGLFPGGFETQAPYTNYNAIHEFNA